VREHQQRQAHRGYGAVPGFTTPGSYAKTIAAGRSRTPSFAKMLPTCVFTVASATWSVAPISALVAPRAISRRTSCSRSVSWSSRPAAHQPKALVLAFGELSEPARVASGRRHHPAVAFEQPGRHTRVEPRAA